MSRSRGGVGGYRGRRTITDILRFIAIALAVVLVLVLAGLWFGQEYIVYTDDGLRLELPPFLQNMRQERPQKEPGDVSYTDTEGPDGEDASLKDPAQPVQPDPQPSEPQPPEPASAAAAYELPVSAVTGGSASGTLETLEGAQALILEMKGAAGRLAWNSQHKIALRSEVSGPAAVNAALEQWNAGETHTVARVCCFRDDAAPYHNNALALRRGQYNWRDELGLRWLSPASKDAQEYLAALCGELAALGFDEIVLEHFTFPTQGNLEAIARGDRYDPARFPQEVESFLTQVEQALAPYGTALSLRLEGDSLSEHSGLTPQLVERFAGRVWTGDLSALEGAGLALDQERLVEIVPQLREASPAGLQAVLQTEN